MKKLSLIVLACATLALTGAANHADANPVCKKGKPCGMSCIAKYKTCHKN